MDLHKKEGGIVRVEYRLGQFIEGDGESSMVKKLEEPSTFNQGISHGYLDNDKTLAEEGLALVARKVLESRREGLKLNESAAVINNLVKRIRRAIEARCEDLKREIDGSAEVAYLSLNNILNDFCEEGRQFRSSLESFKLVMKRCRMFIERFKEGKLENEELNMDGDSSPSYTEHLMQILSTLVKTRTPSFDFNLKLSYQPNHTSIGSRPVGTLIFECDNQPLLKEKTKETQPSKEEEKVITSEQIPTFRFKNEKISFENIQELKFWRSVECVNTNMRPLGLVSVIMLASQPPALPENITISKSNTPIHIKTPLIPENAKINPLSTTKSLPPPPKANMLLKSQINTPMQIGVNPENTEFQRNYLLLSSTSEMEIFDGEMSKLLRCVTVHSIKQPLDLVAWNEWVAISNEKSDLIHIVSMLSQTVSKFSIPGGCGNLSIDNLGRIIVTCRHTNNIVEFDANLNKLTTIHLPSSISKATHAIRVNNYQGLVDCMVVSHVNMLHRICLLDAQGSIIRSYGDAKGNGVGQLDTPEYMLLDDSGNVIVSDSGNCRLVVLDPSLKLIKEISLRPMKVIKPTKISLDSQKHFLFVTDAANKSIVVTKFI